MIDLVPCHTSDQHPWFKNPDLHATTPSEITIFGATEKIIASLTIGEVCLAAVRGNLMSTLGNLPAFVPENAARSELG